MRKQSILLFQTDGSVFDAAKKTFDLHFYPPDYSKSVHEIVDEALQQFANKKIQFDGVVGTTDHGSILASYAAKKLNLPGTGPKSLYIAQNKAAFSQTVKKIDPSIIANFEVISKKNHDIKLPFPVYIKPVKGVMSKYSYQINSQHELKETLDGVHFHPRDKMEWFDNFFKEAGNNNYISAYDFVAQELVKGKQFTVDGYVYNHQVFIIGYTESILTPDGKSFVRFDFPASLSETHKEQVEAFLQRYTEETLFNNTGFNLEFFITDKDEIFIIEFNTRIAGQFSPLFGAWYEQTSVEMICDLACGKHPIMKKRADAKYSCSFPLRVFSDHVVKSIPSPEYINMLLHRKNVLALTISIKPNTKLSDYKQDAYSFRFGILDIAGSSLEEIMHTYQEIMKENAGFVLQKI